jgi:hypothetical protein
LLDRKMALLSLAAVFVEDQYFAASLITNSPE